MSSGRKIKPQHNPTPKSPKKKHRSTAAEAIQEQGGPSSIDHGNSSNQEKTQWCSTKARARDEDMKVRHGVDEIQVRRLEHWIEMQLSVRRGTTFPSLEELGYDDETLDEYFKKHPL